MDSLSIGSNTLRLCIDNDENRIIEFCPTDVSFAEAYYGAVKAFEDKEKELKERAQQIEKNGGSNLEKAGAVLKLHREASQFIRAMIDSIFGDGTSQVAFGDQNSLDLFARFFKGTEPYVRKARQQELDRYLKDTEDGVMA